MYLKLLPVIVLPFTLAACDKYVAITEATVHGNVGSNPTIDVRLDASDGNDFTYGGYIHLFSCADTANERFFPVEEITDSLIKTTVSEPDKDWLGSRLERGKLCARLYDGSRIATELRSNTIPLAVRQP